MRLSTEVMDFHDIMKYISKTEKAHWCVFILPKDVIGDRISVITEKNLICAEEDIMLEQTLLEIYDNKSEATDRVMNFRGKWLEQFYVCCYKNGVFIEENT